jgi:hypothetical protein
VKLGVVAIDGTKLQGNASKHKAMSYARMSEDEQRLEAEIAALLQRAEDADVSDDARFGAGQHEEDLPEELRRRRDRLDKIRAAKHALEQEALRVRADALRAQSEGQRAKAEAEANPVESKRAATRAAKRLEQAEDLERRLDDDDDDPPPQVGTPSGGLSAHRVATTAKGEPHAKAQYNLTDPHSRIQEKGGNFLQGYNCQAVVDANAQVIVAQAVTNQQPDNGHLLPMLDQVASNCGRPPEVVLGDAGYWGSHNAEACAERDVDAYLSPRRIRHGESAPRVTHASGAQALMVAKLATPGGRALYAQRKTIVEPVFGQVKEARGFRRFLLRGMRNVAGEWSLVTATHNLLKLYRHSPMAANA